MKKLLLVVFMMLCVCSLGTVVSAESFVELDDEAAFYTKPLIDAIVLEIEKDGKYEVLSTGARYIAGKDITYLAWIQTADGYWWYEFKIRMINGDEELKEKYDI